MSTRRSQFDSISDVPAIKAPDQATATFTIAQRPRRQIKHKYIKSANSYPNERDTASTTAEAAEAAAAVNPTDGSDVEINAASTALLYQLSPMKNMNLVPVLQRLSCGVTSDTAAFVVNAATSSANTPMQEMSTHLVTGSNSTEMLSDHSNLSPNNERCITAGNVIEDNFHELAAHSHTIVGHANMDDGRCLIPTGPFDISDICRRRTVRNLNASIASVSDSSPEPYQQHHHHDDFIIEESVADDFIVEESLSDDCIVEESFSDDCVDEGSLADDCIVEADSSTVDSVDSIDSVGESMECTSAPSEYTDDDEGMTTDTVLDNQHGDIVECDIALSSKSSKFCHRHIALILALLSTIQTAFLLSYIFYFSRFFHICLIASLLLRFFASSLFGFMILWLFDICTYPLRLLSLVSYI